MRVETTYRRKHLVSRQDSNLHLQDTLLAILLRDNTCNQAPIRRLLCKLRWSDEGLYTSLFSIFADIIMFRLVSSVRCFRLKLTSNKQREHLFISALSDSFDFVGIRYHPLWTRVKCPYTRRDATHVMWPCTNFSTLLLCKVIYLIEYLIHNCSYVQC